GTALAIRGRVTDHLLGLLFRRAAEDVGRQAHRDAVPLFRFLRSVAVTGEDLVPGDSAPNALRGREDPLDVDGAVRSRLRRVVDDHLTEVVCRPQRVRGHDPDLDEVREVAVL